MIRGNSIGLSAAQIGGLFEVAQGPVGGVRAGSGPWRGPGKPRGPRDRRPARATSPARRPRPARGPSRPAPAASGPSPGHPRRIARSRSMRAAAGFPVSVFRTPRSSSRRGSPGTRARADSTSARAATPIAGAPADPGAHQVGVGRLGSQRDGAARLGLGGGVVQGAQQHGAGPVDSRPMPPRRDPLRPAERSRGRPRGGRPATTDRRREGWSGHRDGLSQKSSSTRCRASSVRTQSRSRLGLGLRR